MHYCMLKDKIALVTGASRGIGRGIALNFVKHGAFVGINYLSNDIAAEETIGLIRKNGGKGILLKGDVSKEKDVNKIVKRLVKDHGRIDILVNNAGIYNRNAFENISFEIWKKIISINLTSCFLLCKYVVPHMKPNSKIIFISSQLAFKGSSHGADYATTKAGILGLMRSISLELADRNIYVNAVAPGTIDTDIISNYNANLHWHSETRNLEEKVCNYRFGTQ